MFLLASPASMATAETGTQIGSWYVTNTTNGENVIHTVTYIRDEFSVNIICSKNHGYWLVYIEKDTTRETTDDLVPVNFQYAIDGQPSRSIKGADFKHYRVDIAADWTDEQDGRAARLPNANSFVRDLLPAQRQLAFRIEPTRASHFVKVTQTREALEPFLSDCPL
jgi:hypothetical protein